MSRNNKSSKIYICEGCNSKYDIERDLLEHIRNDECDVVFCYCEPCKEYFTLPIKFRIHLKYQHKQDIDVTKLFSNEVAIILNKEYEIPAVLYESEYPNNK